MSGCQQLVVGGAPLFIAGAPPLLVDVLQEILCAQPFIVDALGERCPADGGAHWLILFTSYTLYIITVLWVSFLMGCKNGQNASKITLEKGKVVATSMMFNPGTALMKNANEEYGAVN